jgi:NAD(P)H-nitrite reductase large subunit
VYTFLDVKNAELLKRNVKKGDKVIILGGGLIALKAAEGLRGITEDISVIELADRILPTILNNSSAEIVQNHIEKRGIRFFLKNSIKEVVGEEKVEKVLLSDGTELKADVLVMAVGVRPDTALAAAAGIKIGRGIQIDSSMRTSRENIYAAGDCVEILDILDNKVKIIALWPNAVITGKTAGANAAGDNRTLNGTFPYNSIDFFGLRMITGGIINPDATFETKVIKDEKGTAAFIIKDDRLYGYILIGNVERAGLFTDIIRNGYKLSGLKDVLSTRCFLSYEPELRSLKYRGLV